MINFDHRIMAIRYTQKKEGKKKVLLLVNSQGNLRYVALSLEEKSEAKSEDKGGEAAP